MFFRNRRAFADGKANVKRHQLRVRHRLHKRIAVEQLEERVPLAVLFDADFSVNGEGFPEHSSASPPASAPPTQSVHGGSATSPEGRWTLSYDSTPASDNGGGNKFEVMSGAIQTEDWGGEAQFESFAINIPSGSTSLDIAATGVTVGSDVQNAAAEFLEYFYRLDSGLPVITDVPLSGDSAGTAVNYSVLGLDVSGASAITVGFTFRANGGNDGYSISSFQVKDAVLRTPGVSIAESNGSTDVTEGGTTDVYDISLDASPSAGQTVTVTATPDGQLDLGDGAGTAKTLTFDETNWATPQTVMVTAFDDTMIEPAHTGTISHTTSSGDAAYNGLTVPSVTATITDNDTPTSTTARINEFVADHSGRDVDAFVEIFDAPNTSLIGLTLLEIEGDSANRGVIDHVQTLTTTDAAGFETFSLDSENGTVAYFLVADFTGSTNDDLDTDDDGVFDVTPWSSILDSVATVADPLNDFAYTTAALLPELDGNASQYGGASRIADGNDTDFTSEWVRNDDQAGLPSFPTATGSAGLALNTRGASNQIIPQTPGITVTQSDGTTAVTEGGQGDSYTIVLDAPLALGDTVSMTVWPFDSQLDLGNGSGNAINVSFDSTNWMTPQTVHVTAVDDGQIEGTHNDQIGHLVVSTDANYQSFPISNIDVVITDNDETCAEPSTTAVINEFVADHSGTDSQAFVEIFDTPHACLTGLTLLEIEGDGSYGVIDKVRPLSMTDSNGFAVANLDAENGTVTFLLVEGFLGAAGDDIDTDDDGIIDATPWTAILDEIATVDDPATDFAYTTTALTPGLDAGSSQFGGASRIPNGQDTDSTEDWVRNNYAGAGFGDPAFDAITADPGEAINTPGEINRIQPESSNFVPVDIFVSGTTWATTATAYQLTNSMSHSGVSGHHGRTLPWMHLDTITVTYTGAAPTAGDMSLSGTSLISTFVGAAAGIATWTVADPTNPLASVVTGVTNQIGPKDDLIIAASGLSVTVDIVPGDIEGSLLTDIADILDWLNFLGAATTDTPPLYSDVDGSGLTDIADVNAIVLANGAASTPLAALIDFDNTLDFARVTPAADIVAVVDRQIDPTSRQVSHRGRYQTSRRVDRRRNASIDSIDSAFTEFGPSQSLGLHGIRNTP